MDKKKHINLNEINDKFTEQVLTNILCKTCNRKEVQLTEWDFDERFAKGDNFLSNVYRGKVSGVIDGNSKVEVNIVVKSVSKNVGIRKTLRTKDFFRNEIIFYTKIVPGFENFLAEKGQSNLLSIPRYITSFIDGDNDFVVLENASCLGFSPILQNYLNWSECTAILQTLARFHAISFAYKDQRKEDFAKITESLEETIYDYWDWLKNFHKKAHILVKHALATNYPDSKAEKRYNAYKHSDLFNICAELCKRRNASTAIVTEGDCWIPNFLIRNIENQKETLMLDFQLARCASPVLDLSSLIYFSTSKSFRDQYYNDILKFYHDELCNTIKLLGSDPKKIYPWAVFMKEIKEQSVFGMCVALESLSSSYVYESLSFTLDDIKNDEVIDVGELIPVSSISEANGRQRVADIVVHAVEKGYI